jgi:hypothetical protein
VEIYRSSLGGARSAICEPIKNFARRVRLCVRLKFDARAREYQIISKFGKAWARPSTCRALKSLRRRLRKAKCSESIAVDRVGGQRLFPGRGSSQAPRLRGGGVVRSRGVHKLSRVPNPVDLQEDRISAPHGLTSASDLSRPKRSSDARIDPTEALHESGACTSHRPPRRHRWGSCLLLLEVHGRRSGSRSLRARSATKGHSASRPLVFRA